MFAAAVGSLAPGVEFGFVWFWVTLLAAIIFLKSSISCSCSSIWCRASCNFTLVDSVVRAAVDIEHVS